MIFMVLVVCIWAYFSGRSRANDQIRVRDVALIEKFLESYHNDHGNYPPGVNGSPQEYQSYLEAIPLPPTTGSGCSVSDNIYQYTQVNARQSYKLTFCLGESVGNYQSGINTITSN
jgi:hypothetical protein